MGGNSGAAYILFLYGAQIVPQQCRCYALNLNILLNILINPFTEEFEHIFIIPCGLWRKTFYFQPEKEYTISKKSVTKQRTELGIGNWEFGIRRNLFSPPNSEIRIPNHDGLNGNSINSWQMTKQDLKDLL